MATNNKNNSETKVKCPVCGTEFDVLAQHEHQVKNATVIGADSGMGTIYLPVQKRGEALKAAGIDTSKYFAIPKLDGTKQLMTYDANGIPVAVSKDDPIIQQILGSGTVPNKKLFRRWIMSQVFHGLTHKNGFSGWLASHGYPYQWKMLVKELSDQAKLYKNGDMENFRARNRWFDKALAVAMAKDYIEQLRKDAKSRPQKKCKGIPYILIDPCQFPKGLFIDDIEKKMIWPLRQMMGYIERAKSPKELADTVARFWKSAPVNSWEYRPTPEWKDAYRGMGAYAVMQNLLRFHGCTFPKDNDFYQRYRDGLDMLELAADTYKDGEGWRLFGLMKQCIEENHIDIEAKMKQWAAAKELKRR